MRMKTETRQGMRMGTLRNGVRPGTSAVLLAMVPTDDFERVAELIWRVREYPHAAIVSS